MRPYGRGNGQYFISPEANCLFLAQRIVTVPETVRTDTTSYTPTP